MKKLIIPLLLLLMANFTFAQTSTPPASGDGTFGNPYQIATLDNLYWLSQEFANYGAKYFIQTEDIDAASTTTWDGGQGFLPIGTGSYSDIYYNGNGKTISNLYINRPNTSSVGLFSTTIKSVFNVTLTNVNIVGHTFVGGLAGRNEGSFFINCSVSGSVSGIASTGGLVGYLRSGNIKRSKSTANVTGVFNANPGVWGIGGLVGASEDVGGVLLDCYATGSVTGASASVTLGGLVGTIPLAATISVQNCYSTGAVSGPEGTTTGGLVGSGADVGYTNCFWDSEASLQSTSAAGTGKTTAEMKLTGTYTGWDFDYTWSILADAYPTFDFRLPALSGGDGTALSPYLVSTFADLVAISKYQDFFGLSFKQTANIDASASSITPFASIGDVLIPFNGTYDGDGYTIDGFAQNSTEDDAHGLFGYMNDASITNVNITNCSIDAGFFVGCIAGNAISSSITNCSATGQIRAIVLCGGIVGFLDNSTVTNCYADVDITGNNIWGAVMMTHFGGLVGIVNGTSSDISNSYALGSVSGDIFIGGLVGGVDFMSSGFGGFQSPSSDMGFTITNCYAANTLTASGGTAGGIFGQSNYVNTAAVTITNSFWDTEVTGTTEGYIGGTGKTTAQMKTQDTFTGWDFSTAPIWEIDASKNNGLPYLAWQVFAPTAQPMQLVFTTTDFNQSIALPLYGTVNCTVDWGDGSATEAFTTTGNKAHTFATAGTYTVKISGSLTQFGDSENGAWSGNDFLTEVSDFGNLGLISLNSAFYGAISLTSVPAILPSTVTDLSSCFRSGQSGTLTNLNLWDVSNVTSMNRMFNENESFNQSLNNWDVSNVTDMFKMFYGAMAFNKPLNNWVVSNVTNMSSMFEGAKSFDQALNNWDVSKVEDMSSMFRNAWSFNQPLNSWDVSKVATMKRMFRGAESFDQALNDWVVSGVTNMSGMFDGAMTFNQPLNNWNVSNVTNMAYMFTDAESFNQPLNNWDVSSVEDMESMLDGVTLSITNYDAILIAWAAQTLQPNVIFGVGDNQYSAGAAATARGILSGETNLWEIYDGGIVYPEITVKQGTSIIENGTGNYDFGSQNATTNTDIVFTIENAGVTASALGNFSITGDNANQFAVLVATPTTVAAGESVTFTVRFSPTSVGAKTATLTFDNEDEDGNPFSFSITGTGVDVGTNVENSKAALMLHVSPNPASHQIRVDGFVGEAEITIINMLGKVCQKSRISSESYIAIDHLPKGMYLVQVNYKNNTVKLKLMKD